MYSDNDIKIAGDKPSLDIIRNNMRSVDETGYREEEIKAAKLWGEAVAKRFIKETKSPGIGERESNLEMLLQRRILLSFAATVGFEEFAANDVFAGLAQKSFLDFLHASGDGSAADDTGAFSFYYLALRKGFDVERRIGQTFAMLCSHDGDPIYQEIGEALYCWFVSVVKDCAENKNVLNA